MFTKFGIKDLESEIDSFFTNKKYGFSSDYLEGMKSGAMTLANKLCNWSYTAFETELRCAYAAIVEETIIRFHNKYHPYRYGSRERPRFEYDCKEENIRKARKNFEQVMKSVSFEEIYKDIATDKRNRYLQKHGITDNGPDIDQVLART